MKNLYSFVILIFFIGKIFSQDFKEPKISIKDHNGNSDTVYVDCDYKFFRNKNIKLSVDYPIIKQTNKYEVSSIQYPSNVDFTKGTPVSTGNSNGKNDDVFGNDIIDIGFNFCFYGKSYNQIIVSDNGVVSFDLSQKNKECPYIISGNNPNSGLPKNSIFGVYHDMNNTTPSKVKVAYEGKAPYRKFIINFDNLKQYGPDRIYSSSQIVLYETFNIIDIYVGNKSKNPHTTKDKNALIGIINSNGYIGVSPPGRNRGDWEAKKEAWRFTPNGNTDISVTWYEGNSSSPSNWGDTWVVTPTSNTYFRAKVTYNGCNGFSLTDTLQVKFSKEFPTAVKQSPPPFCINNGESYTVDLTSYQQLINPDPNLKFTYYRYKNLTNQISDEEAKSFTFSDDMTIYVKVLKSGVCFVSTEINLKLNKRPDLKNNQQFIVCDEGNDDIENVNLNNFNYGINKRTTEYIILDDQMRELPDVVIRNYPIDLSGTDEDSVKFYLKAWNKSIRDKSCYTLIAFTVKLVKKLELEEYLAEICDVREGQSVMLDLTKYNSNLLTNSPINPSHTTVKWKYYKDSYYSNEIVNPDNCMLRLNNTIYIKATHPDFCGEVKTKLILKAIGDCSGGGGGGGGGGIGNGLPYPTICDANDTEEVNLESYLPNFLSGTSLTPQDIEIEGFYKDLACTDKLKLKDSSPGYIYSVEAPAKSTIYLKYKIKKSGIIAVSSITIFVSKNQTLYKREFDICDTYNDRVEKIYLKDYEDLLKDLYTYSYSHPSFGNDSDDKIVFFDNQHDRDMYLADPKHEKGMIKKSFDLTSAENPKIIYPAVRYNRCSYAYDLKFNLITIEEKVLGPHTICDFNDDGIEVVNILEFIKGSKKTDPNKLEELLTQDQLSSLKTPIKDIKNLRYYKTNKEAHDGGKATITNPAKFQIGQGIFSAFVKLEFKNQCPIIVEIKFNLVPSVQLPEYTDLEVCDIGDDYKEEVDLSKIILDSKGTTIQFYRLIYDAEYEIDAPGELLGTYTDSNTPIKYLVNTTTNITNNEICMRVEDPVTKCFKIIRVTINLIPVPTVSNPNIYICDFGNNGTEKINSSNLYQLVTAPLISNNSKLTNQMDYEYYVTENDAKNGTNPVSEFDVTNSTKIWVKIKTKDCSDYFMLNFSLIESPVLKQNVSVTICNNNTKNDQDSIYETIWLENYNSLFLDSNIDSNDFEFIYFTREDDALKNQNRIWGSASVTRFPTTFWVRVRNIKSNCFSIAPIEVKAYPELEVNHFATLLCNEEKKVKVNLKEYPSQMIGSSYTLSDFTVSYHASKYNAIYGIDIPEANLEEYEVSGGDEVWVKFIYHKTGCLIIRKVEFLISLVPKANVHFIDICDETDGNIDGKYVISNLDDYKTNIITGESLSFINSEYDFTYYRTKQDAEEHKNEVSPVNFTIKHNEFTNVPPDNPFYTIYVRIDKKDKTCPTITAISVNVNPSLPLDKQEVEIIGCMDGQDKSFVDLTSVSNRISSSSDVQFEYYKDENQARKGEISNAVANPNAYQTGVITTDGFYKFDEVFVRVKDSKGIQCDSIAKIKIKVYPYIKVENQSVEICEYEPDATKSKINLWELSRSMLESNSIPDPTRLNRMFNSLRIIYQDSKGVEIGRVEDTSGPIPNTLTDYEPPVGENKVEIKVKFENKENGCGNEGKIIITQKETPRPNKVTYTLCDEDLDGEYNDVLLKDLDNLVITPSAKQEITYYRTQSEALAVNDPTIIPIDKQTYFTVDFLNPLYVRVLNQESGCIGINEVWFKKNSNHVPIPKEVRLSIKCDDSQDDSKEIFNLHESEQLLGNYPTSSYRYYRNESDAKEAFKNEAKGIYTHLTEPEISNYTNRELYKEGLYLVDEIYVRVKDEEGNYCDEVSKVKLYVYPYLKVAKDEPIICEYEPQGSKTRVDLWSSIYPMLSSNGEEARIKSFLQDMRVIFQDSKGVEIGRVEDTSGPIPNTLTDYEPPVGENKVEIKVKFENKENGCGNEGTITITQKETPRPNKVTYTLCDEDLDGEYNDVLLKDLDNLVITPSAKQEITYYRTQSEALAVNDPTIIPIDKQTYFTVDFLNPLYVRVLNQESGCIGINEVWFKKNSNHVPIPKEVRLSIKCDDSQDDSKEIFNLHESEQLLGNYPTSNYRYYRNESDAKEAFKNEAKGIYTHLTEPEISNYTNRELYKEGLYLVDEIYVRVKDEEGNYCDEVSKVKLYVYPYLKVAKDEPIICEYEPQGSKTRVDLWSSIYPMLSSNGEEARIKSFLQDMRVIFQDSKGVEIGRVEDTSGQIPNTLTDYEPPVGENKVEIKVLFENKENGCGNEGTIIITQKETPRPQLIPQFVCDGDNNGKYDDLLLKDLDPKIKDKSGHNYLDQRVYEITYHEGYKKALNGTGVLDKNKYFNLSDSIYCRIKNIQTECIGITKIEFETNDPVELNDATLYACDGDQDGYAYFQLPLVEHLFKNQPNSTIRFYRTEKDANNALKDEAMGKPSKQIQEPELSNYKSNKGYVYVRVDNIDDDFCPSVAKVELIPYISPTPPNEIVYICPRYAATLDAGDDGYDQIRWYFKGKLVGTGQYLENVRDIGIYTVEHTKILNYNISCTTTHQIEVKLLEEPIIVELQQGKDYITVIANGPAPLEYSIDKINWQRSNTFTNLKQGIYTFYVRSVANSCDAITSKGIIFGINNVITPNGDNYNDAWRVCGLDLFKGENSQVKIFDRYGKQVFEETSNTCFVWDGKHLGRNLPTSSYWYIITIADGREFTGWIMLRNYNESDR
ncbi:T9SS type B sorting domain-containing protein [Apibacter sp. ESL0432]|uniref:T9SS type B sorting domain-containing protein n=1 Tax=Apibacter sp. ESL0432 TaxID=2704652 RepID=UPI001C6A7C41|nr:T9SS type B sorting domain-containing protein [Apibacter sp. ESL0432]QYN48228.1 T9SS type B sorting domain-containing protein [Apibacter sp. ESL0432]